MGPDRAFLRVGAFAALVAGALLVVADLQHIGFPRGDTPFSEIGQTRTWLVHGLTHMLATALFLLGLPALVLARRELSRGVGLAAYAFATVALAFYASIVVFMAVAPYQFAGVAPEQFDEPPTGAARIILVGFPMFVLSMVGLAAVVFWKRAYPRTAAALLAAGVPLEILSQMGGPVPFSGGILQGIAVAWMAWIVWRETRAAEHGERSADAAPLS